jgi:hypothetical protein
LRATSSDFCPPSVSVSTWMFDMRAYDTSG